MSRIFVIALCLLLCGINCKNVNNNASLEGSIIVLQPLGNFPGELLSFLQDSIGRFYPAKVVIATGKPISSSFYYLPRNRYRADSIIQWLKKIKPLNTQVIAGITAYDISVTKGEIKDYGIMGLGYQPGDASITSIFRLKRDNPTERLLKQRLLKTVVHEVGHNFGLQHCINKHCIMADAEGRLNQDNESGFCSNCKKKIAFLNHQKN